MWRECLSSRASRVKPAPRGTIPRQRQPRGTWTRSLPPLDRHIQAWLATINDPPAFCLLNVSVSPASAFSQAVDKQRDRTLQWRLDGGWMEAESAGLQVQPLGRAAGPMNGRFRKRPPSGLFSRLGANPSP
ncbi:hypothetical protein NQZ68_039448 [Dissostichus eleginoides]|nr:hypothetical protein NQZ68_039448 [Dissostichus eleginoides]